MIVTSRIFWLILISGATFIALSIIYKPFFVEKGHGIHKVMLALYALYLGVVFVLLLFPSYMLKPFAFSLKHINLVPFSSFKSFLAIPKSFIGKMLLFVPFGFFSVLNDRVKASKRFINVLWRSALISIVIEVMQLFIGRVGDIDDVIVSVISSAIGGLICIIWHKTRLDHTTVGEKVMPELPKQWRGKLAIPLISFIVLIVYFVSLTAVNAYLTRDIVKDYEVTINDETSDISLNASTALLYDLDNEEILFELNSDDGIYPASTMKMVTCLTVIDNANLDDEVTVGTEILQVPMDCSIAGLQMGSTYTVKELLAAVLLPSGADACYTLGVYCGRNILNDENASENKALEAFVNAANNKLQEIGATNTKMCNVEGIDEDGQLTTAKDLVKITINVLNNPTLAEIVKTHAISIGSGSDIVYLTNTNLILSTDSDFYNNSFIGVKTGTTSLAGNCLVSAFEKNGKTYISVIMHSGYEEKYEDTLTLASLVD